MKVDIKEYILCAAIWYHDFETTQNLPKNINKGLVICGRRHHNCIFIYDTLTHQPTRREHQQGFMTSYDRFVSRQEAGQIALDAEQIDKPTNCLFSEDLY